MNVGISVFVVIVISDPEHPNFDLEAYLMKAAEGDGR